MDEQLKSEFMAQWERYFPGAELPITFFYTDSPGTAERAPGSTAHRCLIADLAKVRGGAPMCFDAVGAVCQGAKRYLGFTEELSANFDHFLSYGIPGKVEGERYKKTPAVVRELMAKSPRFDAPAKFIVFKRWDMLEAGDDPVVVIFFAPPDVLSGLFTLSGYEVASTESVIAPFGAGCGSIVQYPYLERGKSEPRCVLGMFDVSARPWVPAGVLTFAVPMPKFRRMVADMDESFLITESWNKVRKRLVKSSA